MNVQNIKCKANNALKALSLVQFKNAQQSVHLTLGTAALVGGVRTSQAVFYALAFFPGLSSRTGWLDGFAVPAPAQVTQTVSPLRAMGVSKMRIFISSVVLIIMLSACTTTSQNIQPPPQSTIIPPSTNTKSPISTIQASKTPIPLPSTTPVPLPLILADFPLMAGTTWEYSAEISYQDPNDYMKLLTWKGTITEKVIDKEVMEDGIVVFTIQEDLEPTPPEQVWRRSRSFEYTVSGDGVFEGSMKVYQYPLEDNMKWKAFSGFDYEMLAQPIKNVITPYGELDNCYVFITATNPDTSIDTFCKGIGFVEHSYRHHGTPQDEKFVLSSFILGQP